MASFLVILLPVRIKIKKKTAERTRNNRPIRKGEKSVIVIGLAMATIPNTKVTGKIIAPIIFPATIQLFPLLAAWILKNISGKALPTPTIKIPIKTRGKLNISEKYKAERTIPSAAIKSKIIEPKILNK